MPAVGRGSRGSSTAAARGAETDERQTMMNEQQVSHPFQNILETSLQERLEVLVFFPSGQFRGTVVRIDQAAVELRCDSRRCVVRLDRIEAIVKE
jgi:hypothetical protein